MSESEQVWDSEEISTEHLSQSQFSSQSAYIPSGGSQSNDNSAEVKLTGFCDWSFGNIEYRLFQIHHYAVMVEGILGFPFYTKLIGLGGVHALIL